MTGLPSRGVRPIGPNPDGDKGIKNAKRTIEEGNNPPLGHLPHPLPP